jgi:hypothetical protein
MNRKLYFTASKAAAIPGPTGVSIYRFGASVERPATLMGVMRSGGSFRALNSHVFRM